MVQVTIQFWATGSAMGTSSCTGTGDSFPVYGLAGITDGLDRSGVLFVGNFGGTDTVVSANALKVKERTPSRALCGLIHPLLSVLQDPGRLTYFLLWLALSCDTATSPMVKRRGVTLPMTY